MKVERSKDFMYKIAICDNCNQFLENLNREISIVLKELNWEYKIYPELFTEQYLN